MIDCGVHLCNSLPRAGVGGRLTGDVSRIELGDRRHQVIRPENNIGHGLVVTVGLDDAEDLGEECLGSWFTGQKLETHQRQVAAAGRDDRGYRLRTP